MAELGGTTQVARRYPAVVRSTFEWMSYADLDIIESVPLKFLANRSMWDVKVLLIVYAIVEILGSSDAIIRVEGTSVPSTLLLYADINADTSVEQNADASTIIDASIDARVNTDVSKFYDIVWLSANRVTNTHHTTVLSR
ncbi:hypothetical protein PVK06_043682 [Gossypium arboreum]|uniref:Uncharacterized protein n=1 Tax=Gossypium arboreum TaxID=29729 RepID=A0ABR0MRP1_GOSAR|nr:hypothetical protein PVK06_043682 [Gossypium arboreum]